MARGGETSIRVYEGNIEKFESAQSEGVGVRIIRDGRTGFAYAGTLDPAAIDEVVAEARDNVAFGTVDEWAGPGRARRRRRDRPGALERGARRIRHRSQDRAGDGARAPGARRRPAHPRRRRQLRRLVGRARRRHHDRHPPERPGERVLRQHLDARRRERRDPDRLRVQRRASARRARCRGRRRRRREAGDAPARCHQAGEPARHGGARPVRDGAVPRHHRLDAERRERREGPQPVP